MEIKISIHAKQRMQERGLTEQQVRQFFATNNGLINIKTSDRDLSVAQMDAFIDGKMYRLIYDIEDDVLVTVYPIK